MSLYIGWSPDGSIWIASEMKAITKNCVRVQEFPPGHFWSSKTGGLDSSLIASMVVRHAKKRVEDDEKSDAWFPKVHTFSIGLKDSPDLLAAKKVAKFLDTVHHEFHFTVQQGIDALSDVIYHIETYDLTTVRASTPMFLLSRMIKAMGIKMVLSGEGADEIFGGYLYFHKAPTPQDFQKEICDKIRALSKYDCLRANKSSAAWGVEIRVPFLDLDFLEYAMCIDPAEKMPKHPVTGDERIEKFILRKAFHCKDNPFLPEDVLWRQKEQLSDGVGYNWIEFLQSYANKEITDTQMLNAKLTFPHNTPDSKEAYLYRSIFHKHFPQDCSALTVPGGPSIACSTPTAIKWDKEWIKKADPSGRAVTGVHLNAI
ncbi:hypothetical protein RND71_044042 [Anisodus tanguticus]|uniref:asparagine synthase (glutamine-hydrolyzing) n=1 Tax=Anisodus tanguticus TaxID=243964 RepID=A0AAE1QPY7_9SOLA|nr:hypothetical protein RND71_044042 [Anisodus tanguticus]